MHYLALLEQKTRALDQAAPLAGWQLPECFRQLRRLLEARLKKHGSREYVQVLRLLETSNLPFQEWTEVLGSERLTGALLDRLTHHVHILEMNADSDRLKQSRRKRTPSSER
jgi:DNA replication protein DnaC